MHEAMLLRVYTIDGRYFLDGYALESLEKKEFVEESTDQYYEFSLEEINQMINEYTSINRYVELTKEFTKLTKKDLVNVYGVIYKINDDESEKIFISEAKEINFDEINDMFHTDSQNNVRKEEQDTTKTSHK